MFGFSKRKAEVISHWYALAPGFSASTKEFYDSVEKELKARQVPGLDLFRVEFAEGGALSAKREYLRMTRERLVFDICAAPFGTSYFFSCRFAEIPAEIKVWQLIVVALALFVAFPISFVVCTKVVGALVIIVWPAAWITLIVLGVYVLRNAVALGLKDLDATLIKSPIVGPIYERWFRKETYYRQDTRLMYCDTVDEIVKAKVEEVTGAKGIKLIRFNEHSPILAELYKPTIVPLPRNTPAPSPHVPA